MVNLLILILITCFQSMWGLDLNVDVSASVESSKAFAQFPITGLITITHPSKEAVDPSSFEMNGAPLKTELIKTVSLPEGLQISFYQFELPGQPAGNYTLPEIQVHVGKEEFKTMPTPYTILEPIKGSQKNSKIRLEASIEAPEPLYPGQSFRVIYKYYYVGNIVLSKEILPLLDLSGFQKVGDKQINDSQEGNWMVSEITQTYKAVKAGKSSVPPSVAEGYAYEGDVPLQPMLHVETKPMEIVVTDFPEKGKPGSFLGAAGEFTFETELKGGSEVEQESLVELLAKVSSKDKATLDTVRGIYLKQPELTSLFRLSDLPLVGETEGTTKIFKIQLYPLSSAIKQIPSIEFSYFDPQKQEYIRLYSHPIPLKVKGFSAVPEKTFKNEKIFLKIVSLHPTKPLGTNDKAYEYYIQGDKSDQLKERSEAFNQALSLYLDQPKSAQLFYNIGNTLAQLEEYPQALLYYYKALDLEPRDQNLRDNILTVSHQLNLPKPTFQWLSLKEIWRSYIFGLLGLCLFGLLYWWSACKITLRVALLFASISIFFASLVIYRQYFAPVYAVVVDASLISISPEKNSIAVSSKPLLPGQQVMVLDLLDEGKWLKISSNDGTVGFVSSENAMMVEE